MLDKSFPYIQYMQDNLRIQLLYTGLHIQRPLQHKLASPGDHILHCELHNISTKSVILKIIINA